MIDKLIIDENYDVLQLINNYIELAFMLEEDPELIDKLEKRIKSFKMIEAKDEDYQYALDEIITKDEKILSREKRKRASIHLQLATAKRRLNECLEDLSVREINDLKKAISFSIEKNKKTIKECSILDEWAKIKSHISVSKEEYKDEFYFNSLYDMFTKKSKKAIFENELYESFLEKIEEYKKEVYGKKFTE